MAQTDHPTPDVASIVPRRPDSEALRFRSISEIARYIYSGGDLAQILKRLTQGICQHSNWALSAIQVLDVKQQISIPIVRYDPYSDAATPFPRGWDMKISPVGTVLETRKPLVLEDAAEQDEFPGFRDDARRRGYHTVVMMPLEVLDDEDRPMVFSVFSREVVAIDESELSFLLCIATLADIAFHKMRRLKQEAADARRLQAIVHNLTGALADTLDTGTEENLTGGLTRLFPAGWFAVDLTTGNRIFDPNAAPREFETLSPRASEELIALADQSTEAGRDILVSVPVDGTDALARIEPLRIDGSRVGALFLFEAESLNEHQQVAAEAGRLALSTYILRNFIVFKTRRVTSKRLISRLLSADLRDVDEVIGEAHTLNFDLTRPSRLLLIRPPDIAAVEDGTHSFILRSAQTILGPAMTCTIEQDVVLLLSDNETLGLEKTRAEFLKRLQSMMPQPAMLALSKTAPDISGLARCYDSCRRMLAVAQAMGAVNWVSGRSLGALPALMASADRSTLEDFLAKTLEPIKAIGAAKGPVALATLEAFLASGRRYQETADTLGIHVSTLRYRLEQLSDVHGIDFSNSDTCFELELALRLHHLKNSYET